MLRLSGHRRMLVPVIVLVLILPAIGGILALFSNLHRLRLRYIGRCPEAVSKLPICNNQIVNRGRDFRSRIALASRTVETRLVPLQRK